MEIKYIFGGFFVIVLAEATRGVLRPVDRLCDGVVCAVGEECQVVLNELCPVLCTPRGICIATSDIPAGVEDICLENAYLHTVLQETTAIPSTLEAARCRTDDRRTGCQTGSVCVDDESGTNGGVCCFGRATCSDELDALFQATLARSPSGMYKLSSYPAINSDRAEAICKARGGYLAEIEDAQEQSYVATWLTGQSLTPQVGAMIAGTDIANPGVTWVFQYTGRTLTYFPWETSPTQPDGSGFCLHMITRSNYQWDDIPCDFADVRFLCEIPI